MGRIRRPRPGTLEHEVTAELMMTAWVRLKPVTEQYGVKSNQKRELGIMADSYAAGVQGCLDYLQRHGIIEEPSHE